MWVQARLHPRKVMVSAHSWRRMHALLPVTPVHLLAVTSSAAAFYRFEPGLSRQPSMQVTCGVRAGCSCLG